MLRMNPVSEEEEVRLLFTLYTLQVDGAIHRGAGGELYDECLHLNVIVLKILNISGM
jgi:hypothetical protein